MYQGDYDKFILFVAGKGCKKAVEEKKRLGCNMLFSQLNERKEIKEMAEQIRAGTCTAKLMVDSGAYSAFTLGKTVDIDDYINFINEYGDAFFTFVALDVIGTGSHESEIAAPKKSWDNFLYMAERVKPELRHKLMPVYHANEDLKWLKNMLEYTFPDNGKHIEYIGLGALTEGNKRQRKEWSDICFDIIRKSSNPMVHTHAFGCTQLEVNETTPFTSADSTSWIQQSIYGSILVNGRAVFVSERSEGTHSPHYKTESEEFRKSLAEHLAKFDLTIEDVADSIDMRQIYHLRMYRDWELHYKYKGSTKHKNSLFGV